MCWWWSRPAGSRVKLKLDSELGHLTVSRPLPLGLHYPFDWGFIPSTRSEDGDPLDAMLYGTGPGKPGTVVPARLLGVLKVEQNRKHGPGRQRNDRLFLAPVQAADGDAPRDVFAFPERLRAELEDFFVWSTRWRRRTCDSSAGAASTRPRPFSPPPSALPGANRAERKTDAQRTARRGRRLDDARW